MSISKLINAKELRLAQKIINNAKISSPPKLLIDLKNELSLKDPDEDKIIHWISEDIGLAAKIIKTINMPAYGLSVEVKSIEHAFSLFGIEKLKRFIIEPAYKQALDQSLSGFEAISEHSHQIGLIAEIIGVETEHQKMAGVFYLSGLFHDVGSLCLASQYSDYLNFFKENSHLRISFPMLERKKYQVSHTAVGVLLAKHWGLSTEICNAIYLHHTPISTFHMEVDSISNTLASTLMLADYIYHKYNNKLHVAPSEESELSYRTSVEELMIAEDTLELIENDCQDIF
jgi:HD-like signal output (HDOD) protein